MKNKILKNKKIHILLWICLIFVLGRYIYLDASKSDLIISPHPDGKNYAFTITDDPDKNKFNKTKIVYDFLIEEGLRTTALVWVKRADKTNLPPIKLVTNYKYGDTTEKKEYLEYFQNLQSIGFEIGTHTVSAGADYREDTLKGYEVFKEQFGDYPKLVVMHSHNLENLYWGKYSFNNPVLSFIAGIIAKVPYGGHIDGNKYFWGDFAKEHIKYVRMWGTPNINTLAFNPGMPYHEKEKAYVNNFFSFSDGYNFKIFSKLLTDRNIEKLKGERGISIVYTHFADGFVKDLKLNPDFKRQIRKISRDSSAWLAPASTILDRLLHLKNLNIYETDGAYLVSNCNEEKITGVTVLSYKQKIFFDNIGNRIVSNKENEILLGDINPRQTCILYKSWPPVQKNAISNHVITKNVPNGYIVINRTNEIVYDIKPEVPFQKKFFDLSGKEITKIDNEYHINEIKPFHVQIFLNDKSGLITGSEIGTYEKAKLIIGRIMVFIQDGNFLNKKWWRR